MYALLALTSVKYDKMKNFCSKLISKPVSIVYFSGNRASDCHVGNLTRRTSDCHVGNLTR
jgi:hypothetical protein